MAVGDAINTVVLPFFGRPTSRTPRWMRRVRARARLARRRTIALGWEPWLFLLALCILPVVAFFDRASPHEDVTRRVERERHELLSSRGWLQCEQPLSHASVTLWRAATSFDLLADSGKLSGEPCDASFGAKAAELVDVELGRYPAKFLERVGLHDVLLCRKLEQEGVRIPSLPNVDGLLLLDAEIDGDEAYLRRLVHHEIYHFVDRVTGALDDDRAWLELNEQSFHYGDGGRAMRAPGSAAFDPGLAGFVSLYATSALAEDKAEVFSFALATPDALSRLAQRDPIVMAKKQALRQRLLRILPEQPLLSDDLLRRSGFFHERSESEPRDTPALRWSEVYLHRHNFQIFQSNTPLFSHGSPALLTSALTNLSRTTKMSGISMMHDVVVPRERGSTAMEEAWASMRR